MLGSNSQLPFGISHWIDNSHELFFLFPLISFQLKVLPDKVVNLHEVLSTQNILYFPTGLFCQLLQIIWYKRTMLSELPDSIKCFFFFFGGGGGGGKKRREGREREREREGLKLL